jgi:hypothetical protein
MIEMEQDQAAFADNSSSATPMEQSIANSALTSAAEGAPSQATQM